MPKKKKDKKGKGAEKTAAKTEKNAERKNKKLVKEQGEDDIESMIAQFKEADEKRAQVVEEKCSPPSPRSNMTLTPHPDRDELIMFGGQYCNGAKTTMFNELLVYNLKNNEWSQITAPNAPPPRCSHQAVTLKQGGGQLWIFGGEFESPKQLQFYHYNDLWVFHLKQKSWEKISAKGGPSARSGHRMVATKKQLIVFGGFYDVGDFKYFNDVYAFSFEEYTWSKLDPSGLGPSPRSGCVLSVLQDLNKVLIYGGYSREKIKKDVDQGHTHTDMFLLVPESKEKDKIPLKWKWVSQKQSGNKPVGRCGVSLANTPGNRALIFGGVFDEEEDEENIQGVFFNDLHSLELDTGKWHQVFLRSKIGKEKKKRRRKIRTEDGEEISEEEEDDALEEDVKKIKVDETPSVSTVSDGIFTVVQSDVPSTTFDDGIFTVTVGGPSSTSASATEQGEEDVVSQTSGCWPSPRMNAALAVKGSHLYVYGGLREDGDKQITLTDFYKLDLHKLESWEVLHKGAEKQEWLESESEDDDDGDKMDIAEGASGEDSSDDDDSDMDLGPAPDPRRNESAEDYFSRNKDYWMIKADEVVEEEGLKVTTKQLKKAAKKMAEEHFTDFAQQDK